MRRGKGSKHYGLGKDMPMLEKNFAAPLIKGSAPLGNTEFDQEIEDIRAYNDNIYNINLLYTDAIDIEDNQVILRAFLREPDVKQVGDSQIVDYGTSPYDEVEVITQGAGGARAINKHVKNPFKFMRMAVVVHSKTDYLKTGDVVQIPFIKPKAVKLLSDAHIEYDYMYIHPLANISTPTKDVKSEHYGYMQMDFRNLTVKLKKEYVNKFFENRVELK